MRASAVWVVSIWAIGCSSVSAQEAKEKALPNQVREIFTKYCYACHGQNGAKKGRFANVLDFPRLVKDSYYVKPKDPAEGELFPRMANKSMPPRDKEGDPPLPRPTDDEIALVKKWIEGGAVTPASENLKPRTFVSLKEELQGMRTYLCKADKADRPFLRFFSLRHLHNMPNDGERAVRDEDLRLHQAALSKLINSLSWKKPVIVPQAVPATQGTVFAVNIHELDWDRNQLWRKILDLYPYALTYENHSDPVIRDLAQDIYQDSTTNVPHLRADWFIATASRPPLYHTLLQIPEQASDLEKRLGVNVNENIIAGEAKRAGFTQSGVSGSNRLVERHATTHGAYWKSYDFKKSTGLGNLFVFPLGPNFKGHPFEGQNAFVHDGGELIFHLPNGFQGYMLLDGKDKRIDAGPIEVVRDSNEASGTAQVVNGLSCMGCHFHGMRTFKDQIRSGHILGGERKTFVEQLYPPVKVMDALVAEDANLFVVALEKACGKFLKVGADKDKDIKFFAESITPIARWYLVKDLDAATAALELGLKNPDDLVGLIKGNDGLQIKGLFPLARQQTIKREVWENTAFLVSPFQEAAQKLKLGTPLAR